MFEELRIEWAWLMRNSRLREPLKGVSTAPPTIQIRFENNAYAPSLPICMEPDAALVTSFTGTVC